MADAPPPRHVLLVTDGDAHESARRLTEAVESGGRFAVSAVSVTANGVPALSQPGEHGFSAVVLALAQPVDLPQAHAAGLMKFVRAGGGLVALHQSGAALSNNPELAAMIGAEIESRSPAPFEYQVEFSRDARSGNHLVATRADDFVLHDRFLQLNAPEDARVFAHAHLSGRPTPVAYSREVESGRAVYLAPGGAPDAMASPHFQRLLHRAVRLACGDEAEGLFRVGILGYGGAFSMGAKHAQAIDAQPGLTVTAVCDQDPARTEEASRTLGEHIRTCNDMERFLADDGVDMVIVILPHNLHAQACTAAARAGKHVITEKPFCLTLDEADTMMAAAREQQVMLSCFHNRRWDGDFRQILTLVRDGEIGEVFHLDASTGDWGMPRAWWRSSKEISGGVLYDWGAHYVDWLLNLHPRPIESVTGHLQKRYWHNVSNEDYALVTIRFEGGTTATLEQGSLIAVPRAGWRILGTLGGITNAGPGGEVSLTRMDQGMNRHTTLSPWDKKWHNYYQNVANHLLLGEQLIVTPRQARRVIGVLQLAEQSHAQGGRPLPLPGEDQTPAYLDPL